MRVLDVIPGAGDWVTACYGMMVDGDLWVAEVSDPPERSNPRWLVFLG